MSDLVRRLRDKYASPQDVAEAADMIERLEAGNREFAFLRNDDLARIEQLEAALRFYAEYTPTLSAQDFRSVARAALEGK